MEPLLSGLSAFFPWLIDYSIDISILICLIFIIKLITAKKLPAWWNYSLWIILILRMIIPFKFEHSFEIPNVVPISIDESLFQSILGEEEFINAKFSPELSSSAQNGWNIQVNDALILLWLTVAIIFAVYILVKNIKFRNTINKEPLLVDKNILDVLQECKGRMKTYTHLNITITEKVKSPALFGYIRPRLLLPSGVLEKLNKAELSYIFMHELGHLKRHDIGVSWIITFLHIFQWFNPFVWLAFYQMRIDQESACDASVLSRITHNQTIDYASTIVGFLENFCRNRKLPAMVGILENQTQIKKRITMIVNYKKYSKMMMAFSTVILMIIGFGFFSIAGFAKTKHEGAGLDSPIVQSLSFEVSNTLETQSNDVIYENEVERFTEKTKKASILPQEKMEKKKAGQEEQDLQTQAVFLKVQKTDIEDKKKIMRLAKGVKKASIISLEIIEKEKTGYDRQSHPTQEVGVKDQKTNIEDEKKSMMLTERVQESSVISQGRNEMIEQENQSLSNQEVIVAQQNNIKDTIKTVSHKEEIKKGSAEVLNALREGKNFPSGSNDTLKQFTFAFYESDQPVKIEPLSDKNSRIIKDKSVNLSSLSFYRSYNNDYPNASMDIPENKPKKEKMHNSNKVDEPPRILRKYSLIYPYEAIAKGIEGRVILRFTVDRDGRVQNPQVVSAEPEGIFEQATLDTVTKYKWKPAIKDGKRTNSVVKLPFYFAAI